MKAFNLEEAKAGKPICTRDGDPVKFIVHVPEAVSSHQVVVMRDDGQLSTHTEHGRYYATNDLGDHRDLFMQPVKRTVWVNLYKDGSCSNQYCEESAADRHGRYVARVGDKAYSIEVED